MTNLQEKLNRYATEGSLTITLNKLIETTLGTFEIRRLKNSLYGNPLYSIIPIGYIDNLPKIEYARRNYSKMSYTIESYYIDEDFYYFLTRLEKAYEKGEKLYVNKVTEWDMNNL